MDRDEIDQRMAEADKEMQELGLSALDRCYAAGADQDSLQYLAWMAGLVEWKPQQQRKAA